LAFRLDAESHQTFTGNLRVITELKKSLQNFFQNLTAWLYRSRRKLATVGVGLLAAALAYHVVFGANGLLVYEQKRKEYRQLQEQNRLLEQQNQELEQQNKALKSDPQAIEKEAREHLHYTKPGEVVYTVPANPQPADHGDSVVHPSH
jgi:cell division protein FtsB